MFRIGNIRDINEAISFIRECLNINFKEYPRSEEYIQNYFLKYPEFFIGAYDDKLIGALFSYPDLDKKEVLLGEICVSSKYQRRGIGSKLVIKLEEVCKKYGIKRIYGGIREGKEGFYMKLGYTLKLFIISQKEIPKNILPGIGNIEKEWEKNNEKYYILIPKEVIDLKEIKEMLKNIKITSVQYLFEKVI